MNLEEIIKKTEEANAKSKIINDCFYEIYELINSEIFFNLEDFYNQDFVDSINKELDFIINKLNFIKDQFHKNYNPTHRIQSIQFIKDKEKVKMFTKPEKIIVSIHEGDTLINNIIEIKKSEEAVDKKRKY
jgi:hypothetical protein